MEIERDDGFKIGLKESSSLVLGRKLGFTAHHPSVISRHHLSIQLESQRDSNGGGRVSFHVIGRNPICIRQIRTREIRVFRKNDSGDMYCGDMFCVLAKEPIWFELKKGVDDDCSSYVVEPSENVDFDPSSIDRVKEFGFMEVGKEFEMYPKRMMKSIDKWDWFLLSCGGGGKRKAEDGDGYESENKMGNDGVTKLSCCTRSDQRKSTTTIKNEYINGDSQEDSLDGFIFDAQLSYEHCQSDEFSEDEFSQDEFSEDSD